MSTFWQLLRIGFWMLPLQRALTLIGFAVVVGGQFPGLSLTSPGSTLPITFLGVMLMMIVPLLTGGVLLRMLSSSRALLLRPHARGRLLSGAVAILLLVTLTWIGCYELAFLEAPPKFRPDAEQLLLMFAMTASFGTLCTVALFIASRSPLWALVVLLAWQAPALLLHAVGVEDASRLIGGPVSLYATAVVWVVFGAWYLRARRVHAGSWRRRDESAGSAPAENPIRQHASLSRGQAMSRWVLANATPQQIAVQCVVACLVLLALQWLLGRTAGVRPLQAMMFGVLSGVTLVAGAMASSMARRSRALWLPAGRSRLELHAWIERQMLAVVLAVSAAVLAAALVVWLLLEPRPAMGSLYLFPALVVPGLCAGWLGLMQQHRRSLFDALAGIGIVLGIFHGLVKPLYLGSAEAPWGLLGLQVALAVLLREVACVRWRGADWRRAQQA